MGDIKTGTISITGLADLEKRLLDFPDRIARNILAGAIRAGAVVIQKEAKFYNSKSIALEAHYLGKGTKKVLIQPGELNKKGIKVRLAPRKSRDFPITYWVYVSKKYWYWKFLEFGTSKMYARPFMRPGFDNKKAEATEAIRAYLAARIDKETEKGSTRGAAL
jgi:HK97 gp10 family phage protein